MLGLNRKSVSIILGVMLVLGVAAVVYAFTLDLGVLDNPDTTSAMGCAGITNVPSPCPYPCFGYNGWDIDVVSLLYDSDTKVLTVTISMWDGLTFGVGTGVIAGDADHNGNPGTADPSGCLGGTDPADLGSSEAIDFVFDKDDDGTYDYIVGVSNSTDISGFAVANYTGGSGTPTCSPGSNFGTTAVGSGRVVNNPGVTSSNPDFVFTINDFHNLMGKDVDDDTMLDFDFVVRAGSGVDLGAGEDCLHEDWIPTAVTLSSFAARSSAGGSAGGLWLGLAGLTVLAAGSLFWTKRRAG